MSSSGLSKRFSRMLNRSKSSQRVPGADTNNGSNASPSTDDSSPEAIAARNAALFCEAGTSGGNGEEVLHLPVLVEATESSPAAAAAAAHQIRRFLGKDFSARPPVQYNAIMLIRILSDNPGATFTQNFDKAFVGAIKELLRYCRDPNTQQLMRETLDTLESRHLAQPGVEALIGMWRKEKGIGARLQPPPVAGPRPGGNDSMARALQESQMSIRQLPPPAELASRVEEARNTARMLLQLIQTTPPEELPGNELVGEFRDRCKIAQRSMEIYINCDSPAPDDSTMLTLIETNEQLSLASTRYQRANLAARKAMGASPSPNPEAQATSNAAATNSKPAGSTAFSDAPSLPPIAQHSTSSWAPDSRDSHTSAFANGSSGYLGAESTTGRDFQRLSVSSTPRKVSDPFADPEHVDAGAEQSDDPDAAFHPTAPLLHADGSPQRRLRADSDLYTASPQSPVRAYREGGVTPSYLGRQSSAVNGVTMHGARSEAHEASGEREIHEIDGYAAVGRIAKSAGDGSPNRR